MLYYSLSFQYYQLYYPHITYILTKREKDHLLHATNWTTNEKHCVVANITSMKIYQVNILTIKKLFQRLSIFSYFSSARLQCIFMCMYDGMFNEIYVINGDNIN